MGVRFAFWCISMTYEELVDFIEHRISMSHVYQPVLIRALVSPAFRGHHAQILVLLVVTPDASWAESISVEDLGEESPW